jgi:hypothetical protein
MHVLRLQRSKGTATCFMPSLKVHSLCLPPRPYSLPPIAEPLDAKATARAARDSELDTPSSLEARASELVAAAMQVPTSVIYIVLLQRQRHSVLVC